MRQITITVIFFLSPLICLGQVESPYHFIEVTSVYESGTLNDMSNVLLLIEKEERLEKGLTNYISSLTNKKVARYNDLLDSLTRYFTIYSVSYTKDAQGVAVEQLLSKRSSFAGGYFLRLDERENHGPVTGLLIKIFRREISAVNYEVTQSACPYFPDECEAEVRGITLKHSR